MIGGITKYELKVLAAAIMWWKELGNKPATDVLWEALDDMMLKRPTKAKRVAKSARGRRNRTKRIER